jgi:hypothetical protein
VLDALGERGIPVVGIGKISDIFAGRGITRSSPTTSNRAGMDKIDDLWSAGLDGLLFANLVDFDMLFGHRRDVVGYANALREFDDWLGGFLPVSYTYDGAGATTYKIFLHGEGGTVLRSDTRLSPDAAFAPPQAPFNRSLSQINHPFAMSGRAKLVGASAYISTTGH